MSSRGIDLPEGGFETPRSVIPTPAAISRVGSLLKRGDDRKLEVILAQTSMRPKRTTEVTSTGPTRSLQRQLTATWFHYEKEHSRDPVLVTRTRRMVA